MKNIGSFYYRDSQRQRPSYSPLRQITQSGNNGAYQQKWYKPDHVEYASDESSKEICYVGHSYKYLDSERETNSLHESKHQQSSHQFHSSQVSEPQVVKKLTHLNKILKQLATLKDCGLSVNQQQRLAEIEDKVVHYEKKILENEQKIYL